MVEQESVILQIRIRLPIFFALYFEIYIKGSRLSLEDEIPRGNDFHQYKCIYILKHFDIKVGTLELKSIVFGRERSRVVCFLMSWWEVSLTVYSTLQLGISHE